MSEAINILYVEDNEGDVELMRMSIERYFPTLDVVLDVAETVEEAKEIFDHNKHGIALIDWNLPDGEGVDVLQFIREVNADLPVVMLSGVINESNITETEKYEPTACIEKGHDKKIIAQLELYISPPPSI
jgi:DNA-binding response OmpR family regulator